MKQLLSLVAVVGLSSFAGCGGGDNSAENAISAAPVMLNAYESALVGHWTLTRVVTENGPMDISPDSSFAKDYVFNADKTITVITPNRTNSYSWAADQSEISFIWDMNTPYSLVDNSLMLQTANAPPFFELYHRQ